MKIADIILHELESIERDRKWLSKKCDINYNTLYSKLIKDTVGGYDLLKIAKVLSIDLNKLRDELKTEEE